MWKCGFDASFSVDHAIRNRNQLICYIGHCFLILFPSGFSIARICQFYGIGRVFCLSCGFQIIWPSFDPSVSNSRSHLLIYASYMPSSNTCLTNSTHIAFTHPSQAVALPLHPARQEIAFWSAGHSHILSNFYCFSLCFDSFYDWK